MFVFNNQIRTTARILLGAGLLALLLSLLAATPAESIDCSKGKHKKRPICQATPTAVPATATPQSEWTLIFEDDFSRNVPLGAFSGCDPLGCDGLAGYPHTAARWGAYTDGWPDTFGNGTYSPSRVLSIQGGVLRYDLHTSPDGIHRVAAVLPLIPRGQRYIRVAMKLRSDRLPCYRFNSLLWPDNDNFPWEGEIDWPEAWLNSTLGGFLHYRGATRGNDHIALDADGARWNAWHTTVVEWRQDDARFFVDGQMTARVTNRVPNTAMHMVLQTEVGRSCEPDDASRGTLEIDWIRVWKES